MDINRIKIFAFIVLSIFCYFPLKKAIAQDKPNIIVIMADDMGFSDLGCTGSEIQTPTLDSLATNGVLFTHFYNTARCCPSRAALLTGLYQHQAGVGDMDSAHENYPSYQGHLSKNAVTIAEVLGDNGYSTFICGKWHLGSARQYWPTTRGFQKEYSSPKGGGFYFYPPVGLDRPLYYNGTLQNIDDPNWYSTDAFTDYSMQFIEESVDENKPFFLYLPYIAPHYPLQAFEEDVDKYDGVYSSGYAEIRDARFTKQKELGVIGNDVSISPADYSSWNSLSVNNKMDRERRMQVYAAMVDRMDMNIGRLVAKLKELKVDSNTIVMFLSDNGGASSWKNNTTGGIGSATSFCAYGESWANVSNTPYRKYKKQTHEGGIITPLVTYWPGGIQNSGLITHEPAHIVDIMATCIDVAGVEYPETFNGNEITPIAGESFRSLINGGETSDERVFYWEHEGNRAVRIGKWKLVQSVNKSWELYDLENDPTELSNVKDSNPETFKQLYDKYMDWTVSAGVLDWPVSNPINKKFSSLNQLSNNITGNVVEDGAKVIVNAGGSGENIKFEVPVYVSGYYSIQITHSKDDDHGTYKVTINDTLLISEEHDTYQSSPESETIVLGNDIFMNNGWASFKFEISGKNAASSDYTIELNKISLEYTGTSPSGTLVPVENFPYPAFNGFVVENLANNTYSAPDYGESLLKVKERNDQDRHSFLFFDLSEIDENVDTASLNLFYSGTTDNSMLGNENEFILYYKDYDIDSKGEPSWNSLNPMNGYTAVDTFQVNDSDLNQYIEAKSTALASAMKHQKENGKKYICLIVTRSHAISSTANVSFHNTSNTNKPHIELIKGQATHSYAIQLENPFNVYPNPANGYIILDNNSKSAKHSIRLISTSGEIVMQKQLFGGSNRIDLNNQKEGIYILEITANHTRRFEYLMIRK